MRLLCTPPMKDVWSSELNAMGAHVTTLQFDGTFDEADGKGHFDGAFITSESFKLFFEGGPAKLAALYNSLAKLVREGRVAWVHICASGLDVPFFFDLMKATHEKGAKLTHCPGVYAEPIAQYVLGHIIAVNRSFTEHAANQQARKYESLVQRDMRNCTVGVVGAGGIGTEVARLCKAFGMGTVGWRRRVSEDPNFDNVLTGPEGLKGLLARADFVVVAIPKTPATEGLIGTAELATMKKSAWLINIARGKVVDEAALVAGLAAEDQAPAGAVLDVFSVEPLPQESPLWAMPNVTITPHDSWRTDLALQDNHRYFLENVRRAVAKEELQGMVTEELLAPALAAPPAPPSVTGSN